MVTDLVVMAADGSHQRVLVPGGWPARFAWSPDGTGIAVVEWTPPSYDARLSVVDVSSGVVHRLADAQNVGLVDQPAWSPDGTEILLTIPDPAGDSYRIVAVDPVADSVQDLFTVAGGTHELAWSPDGGLAAAAVDLHIGDAIVGGDLGIWDAGTGENTVIQLGDVQSFATPPAWSPDGSWIAFSRVEGKSGGFGGIDIVGVDGLGRAPVPGSAGYELVSWQPAPGS
jgi:Tol biopolymer transport system component